MDDIMETYSPITSPKRTSPEPLSTNDLLFAMLKQQEAPRVDVESYDGDPLNYAHFISVFKEAVESKIPNPRGRLTRLMKYTTAEAHEAIKHCIQLPSAYGYSSALDILKKRFGNPHLILSAYRNQIKNMQSLRFSNPKGFREFLNHLTKWQTFYCDHSNVLDSPETIRLLLEKLPPPLIDRWNRKAMILRQSNATEPTLKHFVAFMEQETTLVNDPLYSRHAIGKDSSPKQLEKGHSRNSRRSFKTAATKNEQTPRIKICPFCEQQHDAEDCPVILAKDINQRSIMIRSKKLCFGCLQKMTHDHNARTCTRRRTCKVCRSKHATILHGFKFRPRETKRDDRPSSHADGDNSDHRTDTKDQGRSDHQMNKDTKDVKEDTDQPQTKTTTCRATNCHEVISMCVVPICIKHADDPLSERHTLAMLDPCSQASFIADTLVDRMNIKGRTTSLSITTVNGTGEVNSTVVKELSVRALNSNQTITVKKAFSREDLQSTKMRSPPNPRSKHGIT
ncbi:uncharacterized protein [Clytia hemisphaerica]|uniref:uncharacterized protein n=1 Tax=Clytia hemisphaerica TaxID=252671 RepID=UPI0034D6897C